MATLFSLTLILITSAERLAAQSIAALFAFATGVHSQGSAIDRFQGIDIFAVAQPSANQAYVVYQWRLPAGERPIRGKLVAQLRKLGGEWRMEMLGDYTNLKELLEKR